MIFGRASHGTMLPEDRQLVWYLLANRDIETLTAIVV